MKAVCQSLDMGGWAILDKIEGRNARGFFMAGLGVVVPPGHVLKILVVRKYTRSKLLTSHKSK